MTALPVYLDAELAPSQSLSLRGQRLVMVVMVFCIAALSVYFLSHGFLPVVGFLGLDILLFWGCLRYSRQKQNQRTYVRVTAQSIDMRHVDGKGHVSSAQIPTGFARIELENTDRGGGIRVTSGTKAYRIGRFLTLEERVDFIKYMRAALQHARAERYPSE